MAGFASQADGSAPVGPGVGFASQAVAPDAPVPTGPTPTGKTVNVIAPDGKVYGLDESFIPQAKAQGYQVESAEHAGIRRFVEDNPTLGAAGVAARKALNQLTFGASDVLIDKYNSDPYEQATWKALEAKHGAAAALGNIGGFAGSLLYGGPLFKGAAKAGGVARAAFLGAEEAIGRQVAAEAAYRVGAEGAAALAKHTPSIARQILAHAADYGVQGLAFAAPKAMAEAITGDPERAAETWLWGAVGGAALGGLVGGAKSLLGRLGTGAAVKALPAVEETALANTSGESVVKGTAGKLAEEQAFKSLASNQASLKKAAREAIGIPGGQRGIGRTLLDEGLVRRVGEDVEDYAARIAQAKDDAGAAVGSAYKKLDELGADTGLSVAELGKKMRADVLEPLRLKPGFESVAAKVEAYIDSFEGLAAGKTAPGVATQAATPGDRMTWTEFMKGKMGPYMKSEGGHDGAIKRLGREWAEYKAGSSAAAVEGAATAAPSAPLTFERLHEVRAALDDLVYRNMGAAPAEHIKELRDIRRMIQAELVEKGEQQAQKYGQEFAAPLKEANLKYARLTAAEKAAADFAEVRKLTNRSFSPTDYGVGGIGALGGMMSNPVGALAGIGTAVAHKFVREEGNALAARALDSFSRGQGMVALERAYAEHGNELARIPSVIDRMAHGGSSPVRDTMGVNLLTRFLEAHDAKLDDHKGVMGFADNLASLAANPDRMEQKINEAIAPLQSEAPEVAMAVGTKLGQVVGYLAQQAPKSPYAVPVPFTPQREWRPSEQQIKDYKTKIAVAKDPYVAIDALGDGTLTKAHVDALRALAPRLHEEMVRRITDYGASGRAPALPYAQRLKLSMMTGAPLDRSIAQLASLQATYQPSEQSGGGSKKMNLPAAQASDLSRITG